MIPQNLSDKVRKVITVPDEKTELLLSAISPWEFSKLLEKGRIGISCDPGKWILEALKMPNLRLVQLTPLIVYRSTVLPQPFHDDPADQIIVATAREEDAAIMTRDERIQNYDKVRTLW